jgi:hypothetical protein
MSFDDIIEYNKQQAAQYEWDPSWFDCTDFDKLLVHAIRRFQQANGLTADGMCGPSTYRRKWTEREASGDYDVVDYPNDGESYIIHNGNAVTIHWPKVKLWNQEGGYSTKEGAYSSYAGLGDRKPKFFVNHWDVCLNSRSCARVLWQRGISVHFCIDNDGTIYQLLDTQHAAWHAGNRTWNHNSVGVEISNAYDLKWQDWYVQNGFGERPIMSGYKCHGRKLDPFLGFYDVQLEALAALWEAMNRACGMPFNIPQNLGGVDPDCAGNRFEGFCHHYSLTDRKIDCASLDLRKVVQKAVMISQEN